jgi:hypothetical protein
MIRKIFTKSRLSLFLIAVTLINVGALFFVVSTGLIRSRSMDMVKTREPLMIAGRGDDENYYVLPRGTTLYYDQSYPEGFSRYMVYFNHQGVIAGEEVPMKPEYGGTLIDPLWLTNVDADTLKEIFKRFPLSKKDVAEAIKANEITKDDLADIIRSMPD